MTRRFTSAYIAANLGAHIAFLPLLVLLLPRRVEAIADGDPVVLLSKLLLLGGITASVSHIAAGAFSDRWLDRHGNRRVPIAVGLVILIASVAAFAGARTPVSLAAAMVAFQFSLNVMFAPLGALLADHVPHARKGWIAGWLNMALPVAGLTISAFGFVSERDAAWPFLVLAGSIAMLVAPLLLSWPRHLPLIERREEDAIAAPLRQDFLLAWIARLAIQTGAAMILSYLYLYVDTVARTAQGFGGDGASAGVALLSLIATVTSLGAGIVAGRWSDRAGRRRLPLVATAIGVSASLGVLAVAPGWPAIIAAYALFTTSLTAFLSVDSAMIAQMLAGHRRRGALLGIMNLTNTLPAIVAPATALALSAVSLEAQTLRLLLSVAAVGALGAALAVTFIRSVR